MPGHLSPEFKQTHQRFVVKPLSRVSHLSSSSCQQPPHDPSHCTKTFRSIFSWKRCLCSGWAILLRSGASCMTCLSGSPTLLANVGNSICMSSVLGLGSPLSNHDGGRTCSLMPCSMNLSPRRQPPPVSSAPVLGRQRCTRCCRGVQGPPEGSGLESAQVQPHHRPVGHPAQDAGLLAGWKGGLWARQCCHQQCCLG